MIGFPLPEIFTCNVMKNYISNYIGKPIGCLDICLIILDNLPCNSYGIPLDTEQMFVYNPD
jgi:hypothetical protein